MNRWLSKPLADLFFEQPHHDQRHGYEAALSVISQGHDNAEVIAAALMHDVGKRHARLGLIGRSWASVLILLRAPVPGHIAAYRDHGMVGAGGLRQAGATPLVIDFAFHHHHRRPPTIRYEVWKALIAADQPSKTFTAAADRTFSKFSRIIRRVFSSFDARKRGMRRIISDDT
ncbi:MAG TPA: hypothetical protein VE569_12920 [Acidimicrobiia bacterium]|nr:hypothetical protein [Acidimicrobiia bacterium]